MTNSPKSDSDLKKEELSFDGITFEVEEEEQTHEGQKVKRRGIYLWPNLITTAALLSGFYSTSKVIPSKESSSFFKSESDLGEFVIIFNSSRIV